MKITAVNGTLVFIILFTISVQNTTAQLSTADSLFYSKAVSHAINVYHQSLGDQTGLYNGIQYIGYPFAFKEGHPFFYSPESTNGSITYDSVYYSNVMLLYDEIAEIIIMQDSAHRIQLHSSRVSGFTIANNTFIRLIKDSTAANLEKTGFYNLLYNGKTSLLKKEIKRIREEVLNVTDGVQRFVDTKTYYYIKKDEKYFTLNRKKDVFRIFKEHKKDIQQFVKTNNLSYKHDKDNLLIKVSAYYDQLTK